VRPLLKYLVGKSVRQVIRRSDPPCVSTRYLTRALLSWRRGLRHLSGSCDRPNIEGIARLRDRGCWMTLVFDKRVTPDRPVCGGRKFAGECCVTESGLLM